MNEGIFEIETCELCGRKLKPNEHKWCSGCEWQEKNEINWLDKEEKYEKETDNSL